MKLRRMFLLVSIVCVVIYILVGLKNELVTVVYTIDSDEVSENITLAVIADLHSCSYGQNQEQLLAAIEAASPDVLVLVGDIIDDRLPIHPALEFFQGIQDLYPSYYVSGNHEYWTEDFKATKDIVKSYGIDVLEGETAEVELNGQIVLLSGIDDPSVGNRTWMNQLVDVGSGLGEESLNILLSHRPEKVEDYLDYDFDLIITGHAHGGQWRIPGILNGLLAPNQGLFPKYAGGQYDFENQTLIVGRGLAKESTRVPRFYNPPELTVIIVK